VLLLSPRLALLMAGAAVPACGLPRAAVHTYHMLVLENKHTN
jgi:hypothetical protein